MILMGGDAMRAGNQGSQGTNLTSKPTRYVSFVEQHDQTQASNANKDIPSTNEQQPTSSLSLASNQFGSTQRQLQGRMSRSGDSSLGNATTTTRNQGTINARNRHVVLQQAIPPTRITPDNGQYRLEIDSHANTTCFGKGWIIESYMGQVVNVDDFHKSFDTLRNIPIATASTAFDHPDGQTYILTAHKGLDFTSSMEHSLLPPAQV
ncbi:hypothetical protein ACA910_020883 [Epithemia clementina (nom. ined.)]